MSLKQSYLNLITVENHEGTRSNVVISYSSWSRHRNVVYRGAKWLLLLVVGGEASTDIQVTVMIYLFSLFLEELLVKFCDVQIQNVHKNSRTEP